MALTTRQRSQLFSQLATMERAGILPAQAFTLLGRDWPSGARQAVAQTAAALAKGVSVAKAGRSSGLLLPWETRLIDAAAVGGRLEAVYLRLSAHYASRAELFARLRSRLSFPFLILTLATCIAPFPTWFQGNIGGGGYLLRALGPLLLLYGALRLLMLAYRQQQTLETESSWARLLSAIPLLGGLLSQQQRRDGLFSLLLLLESGVPVLEALPLAARSVANPLLRVRFIGAAKALASGRSTVADTLSRYGVVDDPSTVALFASGEMAGRLDQVIAYQIRQWDTQLAQRWDTLAEWLPRLFYVGVAIFMAVNIIGSHRGLPMPD